jgi:hypothetical protein
MKMHHFVSGSAVMIAGWLMVTFFHEVTPQQYPQQRRSTPAHAANRGPVKSENPPANGLPNNAALLAVP